MDRRAALARLGMGTAAILAAPRLLAELPPIGFYTSPDLLEAMRSRPLDEALGLFAQTNVVEGYRTLFEVGVHDIRPAPVAGKIRAVTTLPAGLAVGTRLTMLWSVVSLRAAQERDRREGDWTLTERAVARATSARRAAAALDEAMTRWDVEAADAAVVQLLRTRAQPDDILTLIWPFAARCFVNDGYKAVLAAQVARQVAAYRKPMAAAPLRWLVRGLLYAPDATGPQTATFERSRTLFGRFPVDWQSNEEAPGRSVEVLRELRGTTSAEAQVVVVDAFRRGIGPNTVWDGLSLYAAEIALQRPEKATNLRAFVLPAIEVNALRYAFEPALYPSARKVMLLQAAGWLPLLRDRAVAGSGPLEDRPIDALGTVGAPDVATLDDAVALRSPAAVRVHVDGIVEKSWRLKGWSRPQLYLRELLRYLSSRCTDHEQYQYAHSALAESGMVHATWASRVVSPLVRYLPGPDDAESKTYRLVRRVQQHYDEILRVQQHLAPHGRPWWLRVR